ncbi:serine protease inhibitor [Nocardia sp. NPDC050435]|uniref:serine protease inhibitor n=1 Tax=Nocardia sp. NPDC050435 TaxID=3155040 RepID=UPI00341188AE
MGVAAGVTLLSTGAAIAIGVLQAASTAAEPVFGIHLAQQSRNLEKDRWPETVGLPAEEAVKIIKSERPDVKVFVLHEGTPVTRDYRPDRVRVFVDDDGKVAVPPEIG